jgi:hypothetical protein
MKEGESRDDMIKRLEKEQPEECWRCRVAREGLRHLLSASLQDDHQLVDKKPIQPQPLVTQDDARRNKTSKRKKAE